VMKAKIDASGNLFVDKGNGFMPQVCAKDFSLQCCMACPHFGEPKLAGGFFDPKKKIIRIKICGSDNLEFDSLYFEKTCIRLRAPLDNNDKPDNTPHSLSYWKAELRELEEELKKAEEDEPWYSSHDLDIKKEIERIKAYHLPD